MTRHYLRIGETIANVIVDEEYIDVVKAAVTKARADIQNYIQRDSFFQYSFEPVSAPNHAPEIVKQMAAASQRAGVGPMAAVAGAIAQYAVEETVVQGASHVLFDNGGDIAMYLDRPVVVGIYSGAAHTSGLGLKVTRTGVMLGICTSSATVGHSLSLGYTDAAIVLSKDVALADATATALGNSITENDQDQVSIALNSAMLHDIEGAMVIIGDTIGVAGDLPQIVRASVNYALIAKGGGG